MDIASSSVQAMIISVFVLLIILIICMAWFYIHKKNAAKIFLIGMLGYFIPQICIRYPLIAWLQTSILQMMDVYMVIFLLSISAALLETIGRYFVIRYLCKHEQGFSSGIISGLGHGLSEAIFLLVITYINNLFIIYLAQLGVVSNQIELILTAMENVPLYVFYFTLLERCLFIIIQAGLSSMMLNGMRKQKKMIFVFVFLVHFIIDLSITMLSTYGMSMYILDSIIGIIAILAILYMWKSDVWFPMKVKIDSADVDLQTETLNINLKDEPQKDKM